MKIELLLRSIDEEFAENSDEDQKLIWDNGWPYDNRPPHCDRWSYQNNIERNSELSITNIKIRTEVFGGVLYDLNTKAVFLLDHDAYLVFKSLLEGITIKDIFKNLQISINNQMLFISQIKRFRICNNLKPLLL